jgi:hypothetical protein
LGKNIALFIDGTWNEAADQAKGKDTNVHKLCEACTETDKEYLSGVGTDLSEAMSGGLFGRGMKDLIKDGYEFLSGKYDQGDQIFLFGFSRGAFAARSLAGFVHKVGLLLKKQPEHLEDAYELYEHRPQHGQLQLRAFLRRVSGTPIPAEGQRLPIHFIGVWDTVAALGLPGRSHRFSAPFTEYHQTELPENISNARQALALHELRQSFEPLLWMGCSPSQSLQQVWFPGAHSDVGGGYRQTQWSDEALRWMADEAASCGLALNRTLLPKAMEDDGAPIHNSIKGLFAAATPAVRIVLAERRDLTTSALETFRVHPTVCRRWLSPDEKKYEFLRAEVNATLTRVDEESLQLVRELRSWPSSNRRGAPWPDVQQARAATAAALKGTGDPSQDERNEFVRSICTQLLSDDRESLAKILKTTEEIVKPKKQFLESQRDRHDDVYAIREWLQGRFAAIIDSMGKAADLLPSQWKQEVEKIHQTMQREWETLTAAVNDWEIKHGLLRPLPVKAINRTQSC